MSERKFITFQSLQEIQGTPIQQSLEEVQDKFSKPRGEIKKTPEEIQFVAKITTFLEEELKELGVDKPIEGLSGKIHLLGHKAYLKSVPYSHPGDAVHFATAQAILIDISQFSNRLEVYDVILEEVIHGISFTRYFSDLEGEKMGAYRSGYGIMNPFQEYHQHFSGFNEGIIRGIINEFWLEHKDELVTDFAITQEEQGLFAERLRSTYKVSSTQFTRQVVSTF